MAARTVKIRHDEETRAKIKTSQLLNRLNDHVFKNVDISQTQLRAIEILLRKTLPDLSNVTIGGDDANPLSVIHTIKRIIVDAQHTDCPDLPAAASASEV